jgi:hypothetical protein
VATLIPFPRRRRSEADKTRHQDDLRAEDRRRMLENVAAFVFVLAFMALSFWVVDRVLSYSHNVSCLQFKLRQCR